MKSIFNNIFRLSDINFRLKQNINYIFFTKCNTKKFTGYIKNNEEYISK